MLMIVGGYQGELESQKGRLSLQLTPGIQEVNPTPRRFPSTVLAETLPPERELFAVHGLKMEPALFDLGLVRCDDLEM